MSLSRKKRRHLIFALVALAVCGALLLIDTEVGRLSDDIVREQVEVLWVDNTQLYSLGIVYSGTQRCGVRILTGAFRGAELVGSNHQNAALDRDKLFEPGDRALAMVHANAGAPISAVLIDHYRVDAQLMLFGLFALLFVVVGGLSGFGSLISLVLSVLMIWKVMIPLMLEGHPPIWVALGVVMFLTVMTDLLVAGVNRVSLAAIAGSFLGTLLTCALAVAFGRLMKLDGGSLPYIVPLIAQSSMQLDIRALFFATVFIANSGALMDLAIDIAAALHEVQLHSPGISRMDMLKSGLSVGRSVTGTMITTLFLAYSGSYLSMMMYFAGQGTPIIDLFNVKFIATELTNTLIGCFGLVTVAPFTAVMCSLIMARRGSTAVP